MKVICLRQCNFVITFTNYRLPYSQACCTNCFRRIHCVRNAYGNYEWKEISHDE